MGSLINQWYLMMMSRNMIKLLILSLATAALGVPTEFEDYMDHVNVKVMSGTPGEAVMGEFYWQREADQPSIRFRRGLEDTPWDPSTIPDYVPPCYPLQHWVTHHQLSFFPRHL